MKSRILKWVAAIATLTVLSGCKPDKIEFEIYTSDIHRASVEGVVEVPITATFGMMGKDDSGVFPKASAIAKRYLDEKTEFKMAKGDWGDEMLVKSSLPMGTPDAINAYLATKQRPYVLIVQGSSVQLGQTQYLKSLNQDLSGINMMLNIKLPAKSTIMRIIGDTLEAPEISAIAVFVDKKPELIFRNKVERRASVEIDFKGEDASVYSVIEPLFNIEF